MNVEDWLNQVKKLDQLINAKLAERDRLFRMATDISPNMDGMPHDQTGMPSQKMQNAVIQLVDLAREIDKLVDKYIDYKQEVVNALEKLPEKEYAVLHRHYIQYMTFEQIAEELDYSTVQIWRIKKNGLKILQDVIVCNPIKCYNGIVK